ncbi:MAG: FHA domain-containing protein [Deltaproteobacteria bacterium]|nr:FHA domain-containing protein [Deltaproteobacteria bacterium]
MGAARGLAGYPLPQRAAAASIARAAGGGGPPPPPPPGMALRHADAEPAAPPVTTGKLVVYYGAERHEVAKDRFIIGRGKSTADLLIKDPNISRSHAAVERADGQYYIVDLGSTNGVEYQGERVGRKLIASGDVFQICQYELRFVFE